MHACTFFLFQNTTVRDLKRRSCIGKNHRVRRPDYGELNGNERKERFPFGIYPTQCVIEND